MVSPTVKYASSRTNSGILNIELFLIGGNCKMK